MKKTMSNKIVILITAILTVLFLASGAASIIHMVLFSTPLFFPELDANAFIVLYISLSISLILFGLLFLACVFWNGTIISVDEERISLSFLSYKYANMTWKNMKEICVITDDAKRKRKYIYFSNKTLSACERFRIIYPSINNRVNRSFLALFMKEEDIDLIRKVCGRDIPSYTEEQLYDAAEFLLLGESEKKDIIEHLEDENRKLKAELGGR